MDLDALKAEVAVGETRPLDPDHIVRDLVQFERELHEGGGVSAGMHLTTMNLVVGCSSPEDARGLGAELAEIAVEFPCQSLVAVFDPEAEDGSLVGWASASCHPTRRAQLCCEQVALYCPGPRGDRIPSLVLATMHPDLPTLIYWRGEPPFGTDLLEQMVEPTNRVVFDSRSFGQAPSGMGEILALVNDRYHQEQAFSDLSWGRLEAWRDEIASLFDSQDTVGCLKDLERVEVEYRPAGEEVPAQPLLLAGWLASRLGWKAGGLSPVDGGFSASLRGGAGRVDLVLSPRADRAGVSPGDLCGFRCRAGGESPRTFEVSGIRERRRPQRESRGGRPLSAGSRRLVDLMGRELAVLSRDPIYQEALGAAVDLLPAREAVRA